MNDIRKYIDIVEGKLFEKHYSGPLYHATNSNNAESILQSGYFSLKKLNEDIYTPEIEKHSNLKKIFNAGYKYFLSTARSKVNYYSKQTKFKVIFVLDSNYFKNNKYIIKPIEYFYYNTKANPPGKETEERIFSKLQTIPIDCIKEIHNAENDDNDHERDYEKHYEDMIEEYGMEFQDENGEVDYEAFNDFVESRFHMSDGYDIEIRSTARKIPYFYYGADFDNFYIMNKRAAESNNLNEI